MRAHNGKRTCAPSSQISAWWSASKLRLMAIRVSFPVLVRSIWGLYRYWRGLYLCSSGPVWLADPASVFWDGGSHTTDRASRGYHPISQPTPRHRQSAHDSDDSDDLLAVLGLRG